MHASRAEVLPDQDTITLNRLKQIGAVSTDHQAMATEIERHLATSRS